MNRRGSRALGLTAATCGRAWMTTTQPWSDAERPSCPMRWTRRSTIGAPPRALVSARTGTDVLGQAGLPPLQHVALEVHHSPESRYPKGGSGNVRSWSMAAIHHYRFCRRSGNCRQPGQHSPERDMQRSWNVAMRELPLRPDIQDGRRGAGLDPGKQGCPRDMRQEYASEQSPTEGQRAEKLQLSFARIIRFRHYCGVCVAANTVVSLRAAPGDRMRKATGLSRISSTPAPSSRC